MSACDCGREDWRRDAPEDSARWLRFICAACGAPGYKFFGESDASVRSFTDEGRERIAQRRADERARARDRRTREDDGYHVQRNGGPTCPGGLPQT
jgi:hypothetical protein